MNDCECPCHADDWTGEDPCPECGDPCPFCWGTGHVTVMEPPPPGAPDNTASRPVTRRCPEGCLAPEEVPF